MKLGWLTCALLAGFLSLGLASSCAGTGSPSSSSGGEALVAGEMRFRTRTGTELAYERHLLPMYPKSVVLALHGWGGDRSVWQPLIPALNQRFEVVTVDFPGHGQSSELGENPSLGQLAQELSELLVELDLQEVHLLGHSMGGLVAFELAAREPERITGLVMVDGLLDPERSLERSTWDALERAGRADFDGLCKQFTASMLRPDTTPGLRTVVLERMQALEPETALELMEEVFFYDEVGALQRLQHPLAGVRSNLRPAHPERVAAYAPDYVEAVVPGTGHYLMMERPREFLTVLVPLLEAQLRPGRR